MVTARRRNGSSSGSETRCDPVIRVVFTLALATAVLFAVLPAVDAAGVQRSDTQVRSAVDRLVSEARDLLSGNDALPAERTAARRSVDLRLPTGGFAGASLRSLGIAAPSAVDERTGQSRESAATRFSWRVTGGTRHVVRADGVRLRPVRGDEFRVTGGGTLRLALELVSREGARVVLVERRSFK